MQASAASLILGRRTRFALVPSPQPWGNTFLWQQWRVINIGMTATYHQPFRHTRDLLANRVEEE